MKPIYAQLENVEYGNFSTDAFFPSYPLCTCIPQEKFCFVMAKGFCKYENSSISSHTEMLGAQCSSHCCVGVVQALNDSGFIH